MDTLENLKKRPYVTVEDGKRIIFDIQDGPIKEVGENGCQVETLGEVWLEILTELNKQFPCRENKKTMLAIMRALHLQAMRTQDRTARGVEGYNKP